MNLKLEHHKINYHLDRVHKWLDSEDYVIPVTAEISPSSKCNHRCLMCGYEYIGHNRGVMEEEMLMKICFELSSSGVRGIVFAGDGEPFVNSYLVPAIKLSKSLGTDVAVSTNGSLIQEEDISELVDTLTWIRFSINGTNSEEYSYIHKCDKKKFDLVLKRLTCFVNEKQCRKSDITIGVQMVLLPENINNIIDFTKKIKKIGVDYLVFKPFYHHSSNSYGQENVLDYYEYEEILERAESLSTDSFMCKIRWHTLDNSQRTYQTCLGSPFFVYVRTDGALYPCLARHNEESLNLGNLGKCKFLDLWNSSSKKNIFSAIKEIDVHQCQPNCRHHAINNFLWDLLHPGSHKNFI